MRCLFQNILFDLFSDIIILMVCIFLILSWSFYNNAKIILINLNIFFILKKLNSTCGISKIIYLIIIIFSVDMRLIETLARSSSLLTRGWICTIGIELINFVHEFLDTSWFNIFFSFFLSPLYEWLRSGTWIYIKI